jgi:arylsulfatase A-like enzyme
VVKAGSVCRELVAQVDIMRTCADIVGVKLPDNAGEDSVSLVPLLGGAEAPVRESAVHQSSGGLLALRKGPWKLIFGPGSGGWSKGRGDQPAQLYNLAEDLAEAKNLYAEKPEIVAELTAAMQRIVEAGRSTPGAAQQNDVPVAWRRFMSGAGEPTQSTQDKTRR